MRSMLSVLLPCCLVASSIGFGCTPTSTSSPPPAEPAPEKPTGATVAGPEASPIDYERIAAYPPPGWQVPRGVSFAPDGALTFLRAADGEGAEMALWRLAPGAEPAVVLRPADFASEPAELSMEEELRRERQRIRIEGVTGYAWAEDGGRLLVPYGGDLFVREPSGDLRRLTDTEAPEIDPQLCPGGSRVAYVQDRELWVLDVEDGRTRALTQNAPDGVSRGLSDFNGQEEFGEPHGFFWSPNCDRIAYLEVDEREVSRIPVLGYRDGEEVLMNLAYPRAGTDNPKVSIRVRTLAASEDEVVTIPEEAQHEYVGRFSFSDQGALYFQTLDRRQQRLSLVRFANGESTLLATQTSETWVELTTAKLSPPGDELVWIATHEGRRQLQVLDAESGTAKRWLTEGIGHVDELLRVARTADTNFAYFTGWADEPTERHLFRVPVAGGPPERLTAEEGWHDITLAPDGESFFDVHSALDRRPQAQWRGVDGALVGQLPIEPDADFEQLGIRPMTPFSFDTPDGVRLHGQFLAPANVQPGIRHPVVQLVYGGPGVQVVRNRFPTSLLWQHLADRGFFVFQVDNRGSAGRGPAFEAPIYGRLGEVELADQLAALDYVLQRPEVDPSRVAIYGHSYGGFMAALALLAAPDRYRAGIAGSPVTQWRYYDTGYTERYMGLPGENADGYDQTDVAARAGELAGNLLIVHALMDENVHFQHTAHLVDALVAEGKEFDLMVYPGERHGYRSPDARRYAYQRVVEYLTSTIGSPHPRP